MKTPPRSPTEPHLTHYTVDTGDEQTFALTVGNYARHALRQVAGMEREPFLGFRLRVDRTQPDLSFAVVNKDGLVLTENTVRMDHYPPTLRLETRIISPADPATMMLLADLEQCAAIALAGVGYQ